MMSLKLDEFTRQIVEDLVQTGVAPDRNEAIRMMIRHYNEHFNIKPMSRFIEDELAIKRMQTLELEIESGKKKPLSVKEAMGEYSKYLE